MGDGEGQLGPNIRGYTDFVQIGVGATSVVYRATQTEFGRQVAVKVINALDVNDPARKRFDREKEIVGRLDHPNIVQVYDAALTSDGRPYVAMQLYDESADDHLQQHGSFLVPEAVRIMGAIADATQAAHSEGILHRDIKPQNVLLAARGPGLADFGIARRVANLDQSTTLKALTPWHAAPEAFDDDEPPTVAGDVWSLGSTLYTLLAGRPPFAGSPSESLLKYQVRVSRDPLPHIPRGDIGPELREVLDRAMAKDPGARWASAADLAVALRAARPGESGRPEPEPHTSVLPAEATVAGAATIDWGSAASTEPEAAAPARVKGAAPPSAAAMAGSSTTFRPPADTEEAASAPMEEQEPSGGRRWLLGVAAAVFVVLVIAAVVLAGGGGEDDPDVTVPDSVPDAEVNDDLAPTDFTAIDLGTSADLAWNDSSDGSAFHVISITKEDGTKHSTPLLTLEPGVVTTTVHDLDADAGYCFAIAAVSQDGEQSEPISAEVRDGCGTGV
jgi:hypothetical protein